MKLTLEQHSTLLPSYREKRAELSVTQKSLHEEYKAITIRIRDNPQIDNKSENLLRSFLGQSSLAESKSDHVRLGELLREMDALNKAIDIIDSNIQKEKASAGRKLCASVSDEHNKLVNKFADAVVNLHTVHSQYTQFLDKVENAGASTTPLQPIHSHALGNPKDPNGFYFYFLKEFFEAGHTKSKDPLGLLR